MGSITRIVVTKEMQKLNLAINAVSLTIEQVAKVDDRKRLESLQSELGRFKMKLADLVRLELNDFPF